MLTRRLADELRDGGVRILDASVRGPHILSLQFPAGMPEQLVRELAAEQVTSRPASGACISPHVYNDEEDIDRFLASFRRLTAREPVTSRSRLLERQ